MKKIFSLIVVFFVLSVSVSAQKTYKEVSINKPLLDNKPIHWGFTFGINKTDFTIFKNSNFYVDSLNYLAIESTSGPGFFLGPVFDVRMGKYFNLRFLLDISFTQRNVKYYFSGEENTSPTVIKIPSSFIELPILFKYKGARINNFRPYVIVGISGKYDLASLRKINENEPFLQIAPYDAYFEIGPGLDFYFPYFKFSVELKYSNGFFNMIEGRQTIYSIPIDKIKSNSFMLSFHFEG